MIKDRKLWNQFEKELLREQKLSLEQKHRILNSMLQEARNLGILPSDDFPEIKEWVREISEMVLTRGYGDERGRA